MLTKRDMAVQKAVHEIMSSYEDWSAEGNQYAQQAQSELVWFEFMNGKLTAVIEAAISEGSQQ